MKQSTLLGSTFKGLLCLFALTGSFTSALAQTAATQPANNVLLVHGAWADGGRVERCRGTNSIRMLADDVAATKRAIALVDGPVLLFGHWYGGVVITEVGNDPKVVGLMFIAAFAPDQGESSLSLAMANPTSGGGEIRLTKVMQDIEDWVNARVSAAVVGNQVLTAATSR